MAHAECPKTSNLEKDSTFTPSSAALHNYGNTGQEALNTNGVDTGILGRVVALHREETQDVNEHHPTPPINVPHHEERVPLSGEDGEVDYPHSARYEGPSPLEQLATGRQTSISFNPEVKLDNGAYHAIDVPLRSPQESKSVDVKSSFSTSELQRLYSRATLNDSQQADAWKRFESREGHEAKPQHADPAAVITATDNHAVCSPTSDVPDLQRPTSLTSLSTASAATEDIVTPPQARREMLHRTYNNEFPLVSRSGSLGGSDGSFGAGRRDPWDKSRSNSLRHSHRHGSRRSTTSSGKSPASAFLSIWSSEDSAGPQPDEEGQVVGDNYVLGKQIGYGGFSVVKEAYKVGDSGVTQRFAVKIVRKTVAGKSETENDQVQAEFDHEVRVWRYLNNPHVLPLDSVYITDYATFCFTPLTVGGTLFDLLRNQRSELKVIHAKKYAYQLALALRYLHEDVGVVHRDVKLENCLLQSLHPKNSDDVSRLILCDLGMAERLPVERDAITPNPYDDAADRPPRRNIGPSNTSTSRAGSLEYASPELLSSNEGVLDPVVDIWAFGVVTFALLVGRRPFQHSFQPRVRSYILSGQWDRDAVLKGEGDPQDLQDALELIESCLDMDPMRRWTISEVLACRWFQDCVNTAEGADASSGWGV